MESQIKSARNQRSQGRVTKEYRNKKNGSQFKHFCRTCEERHEKGKHTKLIRYCKACDEKHEFGKHKNLTKHCYTCQEEHEIGKHTKEMKSSMKSEETEEPHTLKTLMRYCKSCEERHEKGEHTKEKKSSIESEETEEPLKHKKSMRYCKICEERHEKGEHTKEIKSSIESEERHEKGEHTKEIKSSIESEETEEPLKHKKLMRYCKTCEVEHEIGKHTKEIKPCITSEDPEKPRKIKKLMRYCKSCEERHEKGEHTKEKKPGIKSEETEEPLKHKKLMRYCETCEVEHEIGKHTKEIKSCITSEDTEKPRKIKKLMRYCKSCEERHEKGKHTKQLPNGTHVPIKIERSGFLLHSSVDTNATESAGVLNIQEKQAPGVETDNTQENQELGKEGREARVEKMLQFAKTREHLIHHPSLILFWNLYANVKNKGYKFASITFQKAFLQNTKLKDDWEPDAYSDKFPPGSQRDRKKSSTSCEDFKFELRAVLRALGYSHTHPYNGLSFHSELGVVFCQVDEIGILSRHPEAVHDKFKDRMDVRMQVDPETFLGYDLKTTPDEFSFGCQEYIETKFRQVLDNKAYEFIKFPTSSPTTSHFKYLKSPPTGDPSRLTEEYIDEVISKKKLLKQSNRKKQTPYIFITPEKETCFSVEKAAQLVNVLRHLTFHGRWDISYYVSVLERYIEHPTRLTYLCIIQLYRYVYTTRELKTTLKFNNNNYNNNQNNQTKINIDIYSDAGYDAENSSMSYKGYLVTINDQYWHSEVSRNNIHWERGYAGYLIGLNDIERPLFSSSVRKTTRVKPYETELLSACRAIQFLLMNYMATENVLGAVDMKGFKITLHIDNQDLCAYLTGRASPPPYTEESTSDALTCLKESAQNFSIEIKNISGEKNPADVFSKSVRNKILQRLYENTILQNCNNAQADDIPIYHRAKKVTPPKPKPCNVTVTTHWTRPSF